MNKNFISKLPESFRRNITGSCDKNGERWLSDLLKIIGEIETNWSLRAEKHFPNLSYNYAAPCVLAGGNEAVLKIAPPSSDSEIRSEVEYLRLINSIGAVKLLQFDEKRRAMLLEKLSPGANLKEIYDKDEGKTIEIVINCIRKLLKEPPEKSSFQRLEDWFAGFEKARNTKFPAEFVSKADKYYEELSSGSHRKFLIHGDLHHENILSARREPFLAIDPKGIIGNIGYEISIFLNNHVLWLASKPNLREKLIYAVNSFSEAFKIEPLDLRKWAYAQMVLSAWWTFEENGDNWEKDLAATEIWEL